jgi:hypothetical protein
VIQAKERIAQLRMTPASGTALTALNQGTLTVLAQIVNLADLE